MGHLREVCAGGAQFSAIWRADFAESFQWFAGKMGLVGLRGDGGRSFLARTGREVDVGKGVYGDLSGESFARVLDECIDCWLLLRSKQNTNFVAAKTPSPVP